MKKIDPTDVAILEALQVNAKVTLSQLADKVNLSTTPCFNRVKALEEAGLIKQQVSLLDPQKLGLNLNVFIHVTLKRQVEDALKQFEQAIDACPEVMECYLMTGDEDYLLRVAMRDIQELERFILNYLSKIPSVSGIRSSFALKQVSYKTALPIPSQGVTLSPSSP